MLGSLFILVAVCAALLHSTTAALIANETSTALIISNARLFASLNKSTGAIDTLRLDGQDLLGSPAQLSGGTNRRGRLYLDCHCVPSGFYTPGTIAAKYKLIKGTDGNNIPYGGIVLSEVYPPTGQILEQYWFLKEDETGLHSFSRLVYKNATAPYLRNLGEFRTLFRPDSELWTHMSTNEGVQAPIPDPEVLSESPVVQDATWYLGDHKDEPYVKETADYFTKYTFGDIWRDHYVHGLYSDGSTSSDGSTYGAWLVMNTRDTYYGGPLHGDLVVDGIVYNYLVSNHWGGPTPNITNGFDRTFGPFYYYFNKGSSSTRLGDLRQDALEYASPTWNIDFYDSIAQHVPNYVSTANRGTFKVRVRLPEGAIRPLAVLSQNKADFQDNANDTSAYQYWADIDTNSGEVTISRVKGGTYRLTIYAEGIFGEYVQDDVAVKAGATNDLGTINWTPENAGYEVWRIGVPDKSSGEYRHGYQKDLTHPGQLQQYRIYWGVYDFPSDFPEGVLFKVGQSKEAEDFNYIHWSVFGGTGNDHRPNPDYGNGNINNWTVQFDLDSAEVSRSQYPQQIATLTIQLAGAKTASGNTDIRNASERYSSLPLTVVINSHELRPWVIPWYQSSSCGVRSSVTCHNIAHKFVFNSSFLVEGPNELVLSLPYQATNYESAVLPGNIYVQYDALRLELS